MTETAEIPTEIQQIVEAARHDPNPFIEYVLDVKQASLHEKIQDHYSAHDEAGVGIYRGGGKTTQTMARVAWDIGHDFMKAKEEGRPFEKRVKYIQASDSEAHKSVETIRRIIESARYKHVFPWIIPDMGMWGKKAFRIRTSTLQRDPTVEGVGIFGHAGGRATDLYADDICDLENAVRKSGLREQVKEAWENTWMKMITGERPMVRMIFTPWHVDDITAGWRSRLERSGRLLWIPVVGYRCPFGWSEEQLREAETRNPIAFARAYLLQPLSAEVLIFPEEWLVNSYYTQLPREVVNFGYWAQTIDFAFTEKRMLKGHGGDPDFSVALVGFVTSGGHVYLEDMIRVREEFPDFAKRAALQGKRLRVSRGRAEVVGGQRGLVQQLNRVSPYPFEGIERSTDKVFRASEQQAFVSGGRFHIKAKYHKGNLEPVPSLEPLFNEMVTFPAGSHDDTVDAAIDMIELASKIGPRRAIKPRKEKEHRAKRLYMIKPKRPKPHGNR